MGNVNNGGNWGCVWGSLGILGTFIQFFCKLKTSQKQRLGLIIFKNGKRKLLEMMGMLLILVIMASWLYKICQNSVIKRNELSRHEKSWRNLKCILLSERSQCEKSTCCMIPRVHTVWHSGKGKAIKSKNISGYQRLGGQERDDE